MGKARLDELVEEALVDAYGESEQVTSFYTMIENDLRLPFETEILGMTAIVDGIDITDDDQLVAVCRKGKAKQPISLSELCLRRFRKAPSGSLLIDTGEPAKLDEHEDAECACWAPRAISHTSPNTLTRQNKLPEICIVCMYSFTYT